MSGFSDPESNLAWLAKSNKKLYQAGQACSLLFKSAGISNKYLLSGRLIVTSNNYCCLEVPTPFVRGLYDALNVKGAEPLFSLFDGKRAVIIVMTPDEVKKIGGPEAISERGHFFNYTTGALKELVFNRNDKWSKLWVMEIKSIDLEQLRKSYGLSPYPLNFGKFFLNIAARRKNVFKENEISKASGRDN